MPIFFRTTAALFALLFPLNALADAWLEEVIGFEAAIFKYTVNAPGIVVAVQKGDDTAVVGFGETKLGNGVAPDGDTVLRVGSITKVFAGQILADAAAKNEVKLTDPVSPLLPAPLNDAVGAKPPIALIDLVMHAGGTPREVPHEPGPPDDPFVTITPQAFADWFRDDELLFTPGSSILYSNFGFDLLAMALATAGGAPYPELLAKRITEPLGMLDTGFSIKDSQRSRLMSGHDFEGNPLPEVPSGDVIVGSGGLRTTANDMLRWLNWHLDRAVDDVRLLDHAVWRSRGSFETVIGMDESGHMDGVGLAWVAMQATDERPFLLQKAGALQGQMSYIVMAPGERAGVFVTMNRFDFPSAYAMADFANELVALLAGY